MMSTLKQTQRRKDAEALKADRFFAPLRLCVEICQRKPDISGRNTRGGQKSALENQALTTIESKQPSGFALHLATKQFQTASEPFRPFQTPKKNVKPISKRHR
jgi:hypothetical protein